MPQTRLIYGLDERPPLARLCLYGLQWTLLTLPILTISTNLAAEFLGYQGSLRVALGQRFFVIIGLTMLLQGLAGHRYPLVDGPAGALLLCLISLAPYGEATVRGAMLLGGLGLALAAHLGLIRRLERLFSDNVVGGIILLLAFSLLAVNLRLLLGQDQAHPQGQPIVAGLALGVMLLVPLLSHWTGGLIKTLSVLIALLAGSLAFGLLGRVDLSAVAASPWLACPGLAPVLAPRLSLAGLISGGLANVVVLVNLIGSLAAVQQVVGGGDLDRRVRRSAALTGWAGAVSGLAGTYGPVPYAYSPGVILSTGVGSRYTTVLAGGLIAGLGFLPKLAAILAAVPSAVVAGGLVAVLSGQVGSGIAVLTARGRSLGSRDYFVVGLPLLLGTLASLLSRDFIALLPAWLGPLAGNGLVVGLVGLLLLEHLLLRPRPGRD